MSSAEAAGLKALMDANHAQNRGDIAALQLGQIEMTKTITLLIGAISGATKAAKFIGWVIIAAIGALGLWFTSLEVRGKIADNKPPWAVSSMQPELSIIPKAR